MPMPIVMSSESIRPLLFDVRSEFTNDPPANEQKQEDLSWDEYFWAIAETVLRKSRDTKRKVGAVIVGEGNIILTTGFNGFPRGARETATRLADEKLLWMTHAETNAIFNAARKGISLVGSTLYVTTYPCVGCAQAIAQSGIKRVFTNGEYWIKEGNENRYDIAPTIFDEAGVLVHAPAISQLEVPFWVARDAARRKVEEEERLEAERLKVAVAAEKEEGGEMQSRSKRAPLRPPAKTVGLTVRKPKKATKR